MGFLLFTISRPALGHTQPSVRWDIMGREPGHEADNLHPSSAKVKSVWSYASTPPCIFMMQCLVKHRDICTHTLSPCYA